MSDPTHGWLASVQRSDHWFSDDVILFRRAGTGHHEVVTGFTPDGDPILTVLTEGASWGQRLRLPAGAALAIAEALKPGPATGELARITDALSIERARVDRVLDRFLNGGT